jgi:hypothetical protein
MRSAEFLIEDDYHNDIQSFIDYYASRFDEATRIVTKANGDIIVSGDGYADEEWFNEVANDLVAELGGAFGPYAIITSTPQYVQIGKSVMETTTSGGIATVVGGMAPTITRNASIYGTDAEEKKKRKKTGKYQNSTE